LLLPIVALDACSDVSRDASGSRAAGPRCAKLSSTAVEEEEIEVDVAHADTSDYLAIVVREGSGKADTLRDWVFDRPPVLTEDSSSILGEVESNPRWEGNSLPASIGCADLLRRPLPLPSTITSERRRDDLVFSQNGRRVAFVDFWFEGEGAPTLNVVRWPDGELLYSRVVRDTVPQIVDQGTSVYGSRLPVLDLRWRGVNELVARIPLANGGEERTRLSFDNEVLRAVHVDTIGVGSILAAKFEVRTDGRSRCPWSFGICQKLPVDLAELVEATDKLVWVRRDISVNERECTRAEDEQRLAMYVPAVRLILICSNLSETAARAAQQVGGDPIEWIVVMRTFAFFHELAHALLIDARSPLAVEGEDGELLADEFAAVMMVKTQRPKPNAVAVAQRFWVTTGGSQGTREDLSLTTHPPDRVRALRIDCLARGLAKLENESGGGSRSQCLDEAARALVRWNPALR